MPAQVQPPLGLSFVGRQPFAVDRMDGDTLATIGNPDDAFTGQRFATRGTVIGLAWLKPDNGPLFVDLFTRFRLEIGIDRLDNFAPRQFGRTQPGQQIFYVGKP